MFNNQNHGTKNTEKKNTSVQLTTFIITKEEGPYNFNITVKKNDQSL
jgi:hypothetical protein